jgi:hypothetical protein
VNPASGLRIDLLFDFPEPAGTLAANARAITIRARVFTIASDADLLRLKKIARAGRTVHRWRRTPDR